MRQRSIIVEASPAALLRAAEILGNGGVVAIPTETVYGLAGAVDQPTAIAKIFASKGRPTSHPLIAHIAEIPDLTTWTRDIPSNALVLGRACWPGPLSLLLNKSDALPTTITGGRDTCVFRIPACTFSQQLIKTVGVPLAAPSANRFGHVSPTTAQHVFNDLGDEIDLIVDGGPCAFGIESTIVDFTCDAPQLLRPGGIPQEDIELLLGLQLARPNGASRASGMLESHYAPRCTVLLANNQAEASDALAHLLDQGLLASILRDWDNLPIYAATLFAQLREADQANLDAVIAIRPESKGLGPAILDRISKAAAQRP
jgi:L-threonylcarbamoyladenylate synthase